MLVEIHMLQSHGPSNPNRDDLGAPKTAMFGGVQRARISSQCIKRSIRRHPEFMRTLDGHVGESTRLFPSLVKEALTGSGLPAKDHEKIVKACQGVVKGEEKKAEDEAEGRKKGDGEETLRTGQVIRLGPQEAGEFVRILGELHKEMPKDYKQFLAGQEPKEKFAARLRQAYGSDAVDIALFGRMVTSSAFQNVEASVQVAHAISTHGVVPEVDYYTAVDDKQPEEETGAGFIGEAQFASAVFYKYFSLDWEAFQENLGDGGLPERALRAFLETAAHAVPTGKRNSYANNNLPDAILVEVKRKNVATSYVNAFLQPAGRYTDSAGEHDLMDDSIRKLRAYSDSVLKTYELGPKRFWLSTREDPAMAKEDVEGEKLDRAANLSGLVEMTLGVVKGAADA